uniref:Chromosome partition protein Smc n=1 Tax=Geoglobus ahangari TaxID=113653 RepID=A0A7C4S5W8_9EURY
MQIKKIRIRNFKSFGKKTEIPFVSGFNVISGPNGSGKSNIIDAIIFCLGLHSSSKVLRADRLPDLIHSTDGKRVEEAEVTITFESGLEIKRRVKVTDKGYYSYYYLNGKSASQSDITRFLEKQGIYGDAHNIIMQGDVTRIVEMTPTQRRKIIEDIAGISEFDEKKEKALEELRIVKENTDRMDLVLSEIGRRLESLKKDRKEALRYKELSKRKEELKLELKAIKRKELIEKINRLKKDIERMSSERDRAFLKISEIKKEKNKIEKMADQLSKKIFEESDEKYRKLQEEISTTQIRIESLKKERELLSNEIKKLNSNKVQILLEISKIKEKIEEKRKNLERLHIQKISVEENLNELKSKIEEVTEKIKSLDSEETSLKDRTLDLKEHLDKLKSKKSEILRERDKNYEGIRRISIEIEELDIDRENIKREIKRLKERLLKIEGELKDLKKGISLKIREKNKIDDEIFKLRDLISELDEKIKSKEIELAKIRAEISAHESSLGRAVELILEADLPGVYGIVAQLADVDEEFALALEVAAGNSLSFIVVEDEECAIKAINYLKQIKGGRATFLPLNKIRKNFGRLSLDKDVLRLPGVIDYAVNLVRCEEKFRPIFNFIFRDTIVVDNIENAKKIMDGKRIITLDGEIIEKSGAMTGGSIDKRKRILLSKELKEKEKKISKELSRMLSEKARCFERLKIIEGFWENIQREIRDMEEEIICKKNEIKIIQAKLEDNFKRKTAIEESIKRKEAERFELGKSLEKIESEIKEINETEERIEKELSSFNRKLKSSQLPKLSEHLENLKNQYNVTREALIRIESEIERVEFELNQSERVLEEKEKTLKEIEKEIVNLKENIEQIGQEIRELIKKVEILREEEKNVSDSLKNLRNERDRLFERIREIEISERRIEYEFKNYEEKIEAKNEMIRELEAELSSLPEIEPKMEHSQALSELEKVERELSKFGDVNLKAIQEYELVKERFNEVISRKFELEKERKEIIERIEKYEKMKRERFFEVFDAVNENFKEIIARLTDGEGELYLDSEDPFSSGLHIRVKPYNKPVRKLEQMSGGEKSLIALAFLFAIQRYKPAPFYVFDEIDMFLDGVNVAKVAKLIREMSSKAQFIVVSLRKPMLEQADVIIGITIGRDHSSQVTGIRVLTTQ